MTDPRGTDTDKNDATGGTDAELLAAHVAGDPEAFGLLVARHRDRLWAVALRTTGDPEEAADALQDAMISAFRRAASFRGEAQVTTWLHRIVVNACLDRLRRGGVRRHQPLPDDLEGRAARAPDTVSGAQEPDDPQDRAVAVERRETVLAALAELPAEQRAALVLVDMEGYPVEEAARILDVPTGTVKSRCARGRGKLAVRLAELRRRDGPADERDRKPTAAGTGSDAVPSERQAVTPPGRPRPPGPAESSPRGGEQ